MLTEVCITDISCKYKEYRYINGNWVVTMDSVFTTDISSINNMIDSSVYFSRLGGYMDIEHKQNRRFGLVPSKIVCVSICKTIKKVYSFNYNQAQVI